jgi:hypothetical protein
MKVRWWWFCSWEKEGKASFKTLWFSISRINNDWVRVVVWEWFMELCFMLKCAWEVEGKRSFLLSWFASQSKRKNEWILSLCVWLYPTKMWVPFLVNEVCDWLKEWVELAWEEGRSVLLCYWNIKSGPSNSIVTNIAILILISYFSIPNKRNISN